MPQEPISYREFSAKIKEKYPQYKEVDDKVLAEKMVEKYPQYKGQFTFDEPNQPASKEGEPANFTNGSKEPQQQPTQPSSASGESSSYSPYVNVIPKYLRPAEELKVPEYTWDSGEVKPTKVLRAPEDVANIVDDAKTPEILKSLEKGSVRLGRDIAGVPAAIYDLFALPQNLIAEYTGLPVGTSSEKFAENLSLPDNVVKDYYAKRYEEMNAIPNKYGTSVVDNIKEGNYGDAFGLLSEQITESIPYSLSIMMGGYGLSANQVLAATTTVASSGKLQDIKDSDLTESQKTLNAWTTGLAEAMSETLGTSQFGSAAKELILKEGKDKAVQILTSRISDTYKEALKRYGLPMGVIGEGVEEMASTFAENAVDKYTGLDPERNLTDGLADSFIVGMGSGGVFSTGLKGIEVLTANKPTAEDITKLSDPKVVEAVGRELNLQVNNQEITPEQAEQTRNEINRNIDALSKTPDNLSPQQKEQAIPLIKEKEQLKAEIEGKDDALATPIKERIKQIDEELLGIAQQPKTTVEQYGDKQEVKPQTQEQDAIKEGNIEQNNQQQREQTQEGGLSDQAGSSNIVEQSGQEQAQTEGQITEKKVDVNKALDEQNYYSLREKDLSEQDVDTIIERSKTDNNLKTNLPNVFTKTAYATKDGNVQEKLLNAAPQFANLLANNPNLTESVQSRLLDLDIRNAPSIALNNNLSENIQKRLLDTKDNNVFTLLARNKNLSGYTIKSLIEGSNFTDDVAESLAANPNISNEVSEKANSKLGDEKFIETVISRLDNDSKLNQYTLDKLNSQKPSDLLKHSIGNKIPKVLPDIYKNLVTEYNSQGDISALYSILHNVNNISENEIASINDPNTRELVSNYKKTQRGTFEEYNKQELSETELTEEQVNLLKEVGVEPIELDGNIFTRVVKANSKSDADNKYNSFDDYFKKDPSERIEGLGEGFNWFGRNMYTSKNPIPNKDYGNYVHILSPTKQNPVLISEVDAYKIINKEGLSVRSPINQIHDVMSKYGVDGIQHVNDNYAIAWLNPAENLTLHSTVEVDKVQQSDYENALNSKYGKKSERTPKMESREQQQKTSNKTASQITEAKTESESRNVEKVATVSGTKAKNIRGLYDINRKMFGLDRVKSLAAAVVSDRAIGQMAKRAGISKDQMYDRIQFKKGDESTIKNLSSKGKALYQIVGENAELETTIKDNLSVARNMESSGMTPKEIKIATGWEKGVDGKWRYEIPDFNIESRERLDEVRRGGTVSLKDLIPNAEVLILYPELGDILIYRGGTASASYYKKEIQLSDWTLDKGISKIESLLSHEVQHAIQEIEGFARGGSEQVTGINKIFKSASLDNVKVLESAIDVTNNTEINKILYNELEKAKLKKKLEGQLRELIVTKIPTLSIKNDKDKIVKLREEKVKLREKINQIKLKSISDIKDDILNIDPRLGERVYNKLAGEVEARNVQTRIAISTEQRRQTTLQETEDVARDEQVVLFQKTQGAMLAEDGKYIIYALTDPNVSTPLHELAHVYEHYLTDQERKDILSWTGQKEWNVDTSEKFARGFEKYLAEGKAPTSQLQKIFDKFKEWLTDIYNGIKGSDIDIELNSKMKDIYSQMLSEDISVNYKPTFKKIADLYAQISEASPKEARVLNRQLQEVTSADPKIDYIYKNAKKIYKALGVEQIGDCP